jgi:plasmid stabilization system protein ParE
MTQEGQTSNPQPEGTSEGNTGATPNPQLERDLREELNRLGQSFVEVIKVAWNSEQRRQLERDLKTGLNSLAENLEEGFKKVTASEEAQELRARAEDAAEAVSQRVRNSEVAQEIGDGLLKGLRSLGEQLDKLASELQQSKGPSTPSTPPTDQAQDIPVDKQS